MDYIPFSDKSNKSNGRKMNNSERTRNLFSYRGDRRLLPRVREYLEKNPKSHGMVDINEMAEYLQRQYSRDYGRLKQNPFRSSVLKAYNEIKPEISNQDDNVDQRSSDGGSSPEFSSGNDNYVEIVDANRVNNSLIKLYSKNSENKDAKKDISPKIEDEMEKKKLKRKRGGTDDVPKKKPNTKKQSKIEVKQSSVTLSDMGGCDKIIIEVCKLVRRMKDHSEMFDTLRMKPRRGILLHGPPGCGKTMLANAIAGELAVPFISITSTELVAGVSGESEANIRDLFDKAVANAPCVLFIDEIDAVAPKRETAQRQMENRIVAQLLSSMDALNDNEDATQVLVIGATNLPDTLDSALRRAGRFDTEIKMTIPNEAGRTSILEVMCEKLLLAPDMQLQSVARKTPGYVAADLHALTRTAVETAIERATTLDESLATVEITDQLKRRRLSVEAQKALAMLHGKKLSSEQLSTLCVEMSDFEAALKTVQPSVLREGFSTVPDVTWDDVGALRDIREKLKLSITARIHEPEKCTHYHVPKHSGILLYGPPGCGKTLVAKALANESGLNFISVRGPELLNMYVGESERGIRKCFERANASAPCLLFFDEFDALCPRRMDGNENFSNRLVNQLLSMMDGTESRGQVYIVAATNHPKKIDPAVLRPGRLGTLLFLGFPTPEERLTILETITKGLPCDLDVNLRNIALNPRCDGFTGADLSKLVELASESALNDDINKLNPSQTISVQHFENALANMRLSVSAADRKMYEGLRYATWD